MIRSHYVVIPDNRGEPQSYPLKKWLRSNPDEIPPGLHPDNNTSHSIRRGLKKRGWKLEFTPNEVLIIKPDQQGSTAYADELIDERDQDTVNEIEAHSEDSEELTFGLERDLQVALRSNIEQLEPGLKIVDGGTEYTTKAGRVDILAEDRHGNSIVVELKAGQASPPVVAQVLAYMASVAEESSKPVRGIVVAGGFADRVVLAAKAVPNLALQVYTYRFSFSKLE